MTVRRSDEQFIGERMILYNTFTACRFRGILYKVPYGEAPPPPQGPTPYSFVNHFDGKDTRFVYL